MAEVIKNLESIRERCLEMKRGEEFQFCFDGELTQEDASLMAASINDQRVDHVHIEAGQFAMVPDPSTPVRVRCSY